MPGDETDLTAVARGSIHGEENPVGTLPRNARRRPMTGRRLPGRELQ